jgi:hypothetical protein
MTSLPESGGAPAFPQLHKCDSEGWPVWGAGGLTKRELLAAMAMQGLLANKAHPGHWLPEEDGSYCVRVADALLAELAKAEA